MEVDIFKIMSVVNPILGVSVYGVLREYFVRKERKRVESKEQRLKASNAFKQITRKKEEFEEYSVELPSSEENVTKEYRQKVFSKTKTKYTAIYNEIEEFCSEINDGAIESEKYIRDNVLNVLCQYAKLQVEFYVTLKEYSDNFSLDGIRKPDIGAFTNYDELLKKYNGGDKSPFWLELLNLRRDANFN
ncbi:hypothetical protein [Clostridium sp. VAP41]|uniref:hypothetical protein n=1 Tax=Clostridium sp. VAP41 TaxID=2949979 RepID=UPI002079E5DB|nr:hypothetical protein [Clostridium sp. VAP41]